MRGFIWGSVLRRLVDEGRIDSALDRLMAWGLVEDVQGDLRTTRRWNARLLAAAEKLNLVAQRTGQPPEGNPLLLAVSQALAAENVETDERRFQDDVEVLVMLELSRMTPAKRAQAGFPDVRFPHDADDDEGGPGMGYPMQP